MRKNNKPVKLDVKYPCRSCKYFKQCGDSMRTEPCKGRAYKEK